MDQEVVECRVEDGTLVGGTALYLDDTECPLPAVLRSTTNGGKVKGRLLGSEVEQGILFTDEGDTRLYVERLTGLGIEGEPYPDIIPADVLTIGRIDLVLTLVLIPLGLYTLHRRLLLPVARGWSSTADADGEVLVEDSLGSIAEGTHELTPDDGRVIEEAHGSTTLVGQP